MGMFNNVNVPISKYKCWKCGSSDLNSWQTKDDSKVDLTLVSVDYMEVDHFYTSCEHCQAWNEYKREPLTWTNFELIK